VTKAEKAEKEIRDFYKQVGRLGGAAGTGEAKRRGDSDYYRKMRKGKGVGKKRKLGPDEISKFVQKAWGTK
jgi:hypothetical protein